MKFRKLLVAVTAMTIALFGCGAEGQDTAEIEALLSQAKETMATVESMAAEMTMEMDMGMEGETMETTTVAHVISQQNPLKMKMDMAMVMSDGTEADQMQMYAVEQDGHLYTYMSTADTWYAETLEMDALGQYNADENMDLYLDHITSFKGEGQENINGTKATKISGVITGDAMEEAIAGSGLTSSAQSMGVTTEMLEEIYSELGNLPISLWIDTEGYVLKYELDMTEMMHKILVESMKAVGMAEEDIVITVEKTMLSMVCSDFNNVEEIVIPEAALSVPMGEHVHAE